MPTISFFGFLDKQKLSALKSLVHLTPKCAFIFFSLNFLKELNILNLDYNIKSLRKFD